ncbi:endonuclease/exonuclease/phosphatase family protein [Jannaschia ovalis]|uniref:Endonuclease/exonuclease/phosphatase family protein n=1 Tax=Jannaschia ovalis TaxID=3038773 RepID=A0ABY8L9A1_9RHOB|nr:endonuclease/exonuclease/phosphatase family protein [Jannaschia sp. GRR-S6-38]WGH77932.1 endonuclease/exonuclease/phosphatase family protein [Jannaschia sp. GRR-S6-38]
MIGVALRLLIGAFALALMAVTLLPLWEATFWWVRAWEFPRVHILVLAALTLPLAFALRGAGRWIVAVGMIGVVMWQGAWLRPYAAGAGEAVAMREADDGVTVLSFNVLQSNRDFAATRELIAAVDPDVLVLMETNADWAAALEGTLAGYPTQARSITEDRYGLILATRLPATGVETVTLEGQEAPFAIATVETGSGPLEITAIHPRPPVPRTDGQQRDRQIERAAELARRGDAAALAVGDFNDVPWSRAAQRFRDLGGLLDPREGRGLLNSFDPDSLMLSFPLDQALVTEDVVLEEFRLGPDVGSDHLPLILRLAPDG